MGKPCHNGSSEINLPQIPYTKQPLLISEQIKKLKSKGLSIKNEILAERTLSNTSYYRLRAYTYPFQDNAKPNHPFVRQFSLEDIISLYVFDTKFRALVFSAIEKIEVALRSQLVYHFSIKYGSHWHTDRSLFKEGVDKRGGSMFDKLMESLRAEVNRGNEDFIVHYKSKYNAPADPPSWMGLEVVTFGTLSKFFSTLKNCDAKYDVVRYFGLKNIEIFENWLYGINIIRNVCAHHGRLWNRGKLARIKFPTDTINPFIRENWGKEYSKPYGHLCTIQYLLSSIAASGCGFKEKLKALLLDHPIVEEAKMGFPSNWRNDPFWTLKFKRRCMI